MSIINKLNARISAANSLLCIGLDPLLEQLPVAFQHEPDPLFAFNRYIIEQTHEYAAAYKPNSAFYEAHGDAGIRQLRLTSEYLRANYPDIVTICDAKRADIDNTNAAYARAIFDELCFDAVTLHPYLGEEALQPFLSRANNGCIILCRTSNPGAGEIQDLVVDGKPLWLIIADKVANTWNNNRNCMLVVGATYPDELRQVRAVVGDMPILVPGVGAQGGDVARTVQAGRTPDGRGMLINAARSVIYADNPADAARTMRAAINSYR